VTIEIREAGDVDHPALAAVVEAAFGEQGVAVNDVMARLRGAEDMAVELVAESDGEVATPATTAATAGVRHRPTTSSARRVASPRPAVRCCS
jgi:predicted N-acetyltransferase YhbS